MSREHISTLEETAEIAALLGSASRLQIIRELDGAAEGQGFSVSDLAKAVGMSISGVSQHLQRLRSARIVALPKRSAQSLIYSLNTPVDPLVRAALDRIGGAR